MKNAFDAIPKLAEVLEPLSSEERHRAIAATMAVLGDVYHPSTAVSGSVGKGVGTGRVETPGGGRDVKLDGGEGISSKAVTWMEKQKITREQLDQVFSIDENGVDVIAHKMPATSRRRQTAEAYVITGLSSFIASGSIDFKDEDARKVCKAVSCFDNANHTNAMKGLKNWISGSSKTGWKLTNPGLVEAARIVKALTPAENA